MDCTKDAKGYEDEGKGLGHPPPLSTILLRSLVERSSRITCEHILPKKRKTKKQRYTKLIMKKKSSIEAYN